LGGPFLFRGFDIADGILWTVACQDLPATRSCAVSEDLTIGSTSTSGHDVIQALTSILIE
jgi:hypothetical protein